MKWRCLLTLLSAFIFFLILGIPAFAQLPGQSPEQAAYQTPYVFAPSVTDPSLTLDFQVNPKAINNWHNWSQTPYADWQNFQVIRRLRSTWGPYYIDFQAPPGIEHQSKAWLQERIVAAASLVRNTTPYAHHHMGQWSVLDAPPWTNARPHPFAPGYGFDCCDFTHFVYSYALGISLKTGIREQAETTSAPLHLAGGPVIQVAAQRLFDVQNGYAKNYDDLVKHLEPGDLLFIRGDPGLQNRITHVILWMGDLASDTQGQDHNLVMDSHGAKVTDSRGQLIPSGPELRPFAEKSYYYSSFDHVLRFFPLEKVSVGE